MQSALYVGKLRHRRFTPRSHSFTYPVFLSFLDIDHLPELLRVAPFTSYNRWNWLSYDERDHFGDPRKPLRARLAEDAARLGIELPSGPIFLLTHLRYFGYVFNPVSFFYCYDQHGHLAVILSEVNNTFGESQNYWLSAANERHNAAARRFTSVKRMHVSPFNGMEMEYDWIFTPPGDRLVAHMNTSIAGQRNFDATLQLERRPWNSEALLKSLLRFPFMTLQVIGAIHWEALKLWLKGVPVYTHQPKLDSARISAATGGSEAQ